ncbi:hypothetical protein [Secundilactobacillus silagei]|uniref:D-alanyl-D-alanine carboxypeptidase n=1 Tax=Secundilactobacillus silagei JCM 19001 TaxID=1302250 RepID=A0A1Z5IJZ6_9LACO|nr:hypothetical protein [Secundilactobacillus silagei]TDG69926.1 hypothetical protein C5L25_002046 [Secundilactobacillus silagei JCM 19001]GAX02080.1 hypothetical protein IWT126_02144 [Secundilactobacillus silagei JCM 19001]
MKKWLKICVAAFALTLGLAAASTVDAHASSFTYFGNNGTKTYHHKVISYQKYTLNKTYYNTTNFRYDPATKKTTYIPETRIGKVVFYHAYVFHVSPKVSRYQTWVKLTGRVYNYSNSPDNAYWRNYIADYDEDEDVTPVYTQNDIFGVEIGATRSYTRATFDVNFSKGTSKSPVLFSEAGLAPGKSEGFQLLAHTKHQTSRLGNTRLSVALYSYGDQSKNLYLNMK